MNNFILITTSKKNQLVLDRVPTTSITNYLPTSYYLHIIFPIDKQHDVIFTIYAPTVFATLRAALGISHEDFLMVRLPQKIYSIATTIVMFG